MKLKFLLTLAVACICAVAVSSCKSDGEDEPSRNLRATRMDFSGAKAITVLSSDRSRADMDFKESGLFKIDEQGNISTVAVYLVTDDDGNASSKEIPARVVPDKIVNIGDDYVAFSWCRYESLEDNSTVIMPGLYFSLMARKSDGRIFAFGGNELLENVLFNPLFGPKSIKVNADEYYIYSMLEQAGERMVHMKFDGGRLSVQEESTNGIVSYNPVYLNGDIYSVNKYYPLSSDLSFVKDMAGIRFTAGGYDVFDKEYFGEPFVSSYLLLSDGIGAVRCSDIEETAFAKHDLSFNILNAERAGVATLTSVATMEGVENVFAYVDGCYDNGVNVILQHNHYDAMYEKPAYSVVDKSAGTWKKFEPSFGEAEGITVDAANVYKGRIWGVLEKNEKIHPTALWINPSTLESGTVNLDFDINGIDITRSEKYYGNGRLILYGSRRADDANVVIEADITTGRCTTLFYDKNYEIINLVPLN